MLDMQEVIHNSFLDYHVKGFHYLCLERAPWRTDKLYFFEGDVASLPEVVAPHDHRYDFDTLCVTGRVENRWYREEVAAASRGRKTRAFQQFDYMTPLNGGGGFTWVGETWLTPFLSKLCGPGMGYCMGAEELHTIQIRKPETILRLTQYDDVVPIGKPTRTFTLNREPPSLSGLYRKPTADDVIRLAQIARKHVGIPFID